MSHDGLTVVGEAADGQEALSVYRDLHGPPEPNVVILDNRMPHLTGIEVAEQILKDRPDQLIVLYSAFLDDALTAQAAAVGITRCISKTELEQLPALIAELTDR